MSLPLRPLDLSALLRGGVAPTPATRWLIALNGAMFVLMLLQGGGFWHGSSPVALAWGANFGPATQDGQWWRLASAMFVHFGVLHLGLNLLALWDAGRLLEQLAGGWRVLLLFLLSGVLGNLLSLVVQGNQVVSGGASGAIFGLYGALLVMLWQVRHRVERREFGWVFGSILAFASLTLALGWLAPSIDNAAHLGGLVAGALLGCSLAPAPAAGVARTHWHRALSAGALMLAATWLLVHLPAPSYRIQQELLAQQAMARFLAEDRRISQRWASLLRQPVSASVVMAQSFDALAGSIDEEVSQAYELSFEALANADPGAGAPSAPALRAMQDYAAARAQTSRNLAEGLRQRDTERIRQALGQAKASPPKVFAPSPKASREKAIQTKP